MDEDKKDYDIVAFSRTNISLIRNLRNISYLRAEDMGSEAHDFISTKTLMVGLPPNILGKSQEGAIPRTYPEAKKRAKEVVGS